ncbi:MAG: Holliday junction branch migration protein RuvA [Deltaproteobacteria bacterium]|nr:Holliday junction branch migration protein RuvA [Deltaproteobacteria bacterium]
MIGYLRGKLITCYEGKALIWIGAGESPLGIGYTVNLPQSTCYTNLQVGEILELFIYHHIREAAFDLYGFFSKSEKEIFMTLLSVSGIGPKLALNIISHLSPANLVESIFSKNRDILLDIPGIGKKMAERIILELYDPIKKKIENDGTLAEEIKRTKMQNTPLKTIPQIMFDEAKEALMHLGFREGEIVNVFKQFETQTIAPESTEKLIRQALVQLS